MVVIECPHCSEDIEMDDGAYGLFECPYCEGEYERGEVPKSTSKSISKRKKNLFQNTNRKIDFSIIINIMVRLLRIILGNRIFKEIYEKPSWKVAIFCYLIIAILSFLYL